MSDAEYNEFLARVQASGMTQQAYVTTALAGSLLATPEDTAALWDLKKTLESLVGQLRGLGINLNQLAHVANISGAIQDESFLRELAEKVADERREAYGVWLSLSALMAARKGQGTEEALHSTE